MNEQDLEILAIIIYQEAGGDACSDETRLLVGNVFLNRVADGYWGDTFLEVATAPSQYGTLSKTGIKWPRRAVNAGEKHAVERAYSLALRLMQGERVCPSDVIWQAQFPQASYRQKVKIFKKQDGLYFCHK